jgi:hypothetical protein
VANGGVVAMLAASRRRTSMTVARRSNGRSWRWRRMALPDATPCTGAAARPYSPPGSPLWFMCYICTAHRRGFLCKNSSSFPAPAEKKNLRRFSDSGATKKTASYMCFCCTGYAVRQVYCWICAPG